MQANGDGTKDGRKGTGDGRRAAGVIAFHRPARIFPPLPPHSSIPIATPPTVPSPSSGSLLQLLFPLVGSLGMVGFAIIYRNPLFLAIAGGIAGMMLVLSIAMRRQAKKRLARTRKQNAEKYRAHLEDRKKILEEVAEAQRDVLEHIHPGIEGLWSIVNSRTQLWERRPHDPDFLEFRVGRGDVPLAAPIEFDTGHDPLTEFEPDLSDEASELVAATSKLKMAPIGLSMRDAGAVAVVGPPKETRAFGRAVLAEAAVMHAPDDVKMIAAFARSDVDEWRWMKWLPHARASTDASTDDAVAVSLAVDPEDFEILLSQVVKPRLEHLERTRNQPGEEKVRFQQVIVLIDACSHPQLGHLEIYEQMLRRAGEIGILAFVLLSEPRLVPSTVGIRMEIEEGGWLSFARSGPDGERMAEIKAEGAGVQLCEAIARTIAPLRLRIREDQARRVDSESLLDLLHVGGATDLDPAVRWKPKPTNELLSTLIGIAEDGSHAVLDLKESAEGGMGPHGLIVGATGSGKSELLRTLVTGLALTHSPEELAFVLVDYKGGAAFTELSRLPHSAGMITNIENDLTLVDRMHEALFGELERRQRLLQSVGQFDGARDYQQHRAEHPEKQLPPLPSLLVVVDEFGELLASRPDFLELFVSIGRTGRSLGVHLLLSTQRLDEGRIRGLEGHLRYRICLRTFSAEESVLTLGTRDAFEMPPLPGLAYLRVDQTLDHFKAALSTRPYREQRGIETEDLRMVRDFDIVSDEPSLAVPLDAPPRPGPARTRGPLRTEMQVVVDRLAETAPERSARQVWLPPLPGALSLDAAGEDWDKTTAPGEPGWLLAPVGIMDHPREQDQLPFSLNFNGREGHLAVIGAPRSGKSTFLQTLTCSLALTHDPRDVQIYGIDLGGGALHALRDLSLVGEIYGRAERIGILRLIRELRSLLAQRSESFRRAGLSSMQAYHQARREEPSEDDGYGEVFLFIDNWSLLVTEFEDLQYEIVELVTGGLHYGIHVVVTTNRWQDLRLNLRDNIGGRLEFRLNDPVESEIDRHAAKALPVDVAGRAIERTGHQVQIALPRLDARSDITGLGLALEEVAARAGARWKDSPAAPRIKMLPREITLEDIPPTDGRVPIGVEEFGLGPVSLAPDDTQPHLVVLGDSGCGKTNLMRVLMRGLTETFSPEQVEIAIIDLRRRLITDARGLPHITGIATNSVTAGELALKLSGEMSGRIPGHDAEPDAAATWAGSHLYLLVDDYDLLVSAAGNPLSPLVDLLAQGRDIGLHIVMARRVGGTTRSSFEPFFQRLVELGSPGLIMSGDPQEGPLIGGVKAQPLPPGRGTLVERNRTSLIQTIFMPDTTESVASRGGTP